MLIPIKDLTIGTIAAGFGLGGIAANYCGFSYGLQAAEEVAERIGCDINYVRLVETPYRGGVYLGKKLRGK